MDFFFWVFNSVLLINFSVFIPVHCCLLYCIFVIELEIKYSSNLQQDSVENKAMRLEPSYSLLEKRKGSSNHSWYQQSCWRKQSILKYYHPQSTPNTISMGPLGEAELFPLPKSKQESLSSQLLLVPLGETWTFTSLGKNRDRHISSYTQRLQYFFFNS